MTALDYPSNTLYVGVHIPKTGGVTLRAILRAVFGSSLQEAYGDAPPSVRVVNPACVYGHDVFIMFPELLGQPRMFRRFTFLREPLNLAVSLYFHARRTLGPSNFSDRGLAHWLTHEEPYRWPDPPCHSHNHYRSWIEQDCQTLDTFDFVGITEQFDQSMEAMTRQFGWSLPEYKAENVGGDPRPDLDQKLVDRFKSLNDDDYAIYEAAKRRLEGRA